MSPEEAHKRYRALAAEAVDLGAGRLVWKEVKEGGWTVRGTKLRFPHNPWGRTPVDALDELVVLLRRVMR